MNGAYGEERIALFQARNAESNERKEEGQDNIRELIHNCRRKSLSHQLSRITTFFERARLISSFIAATRPKTWVQYRVRERN